MSTEKLSERMHRLTGHVGAGVVHDFATEVAALEEEANPLTWQLYEQTRAKLAAAEAKLERVRVFAKERQSMMVGGLMIGPTELLALLLRDEPAPAPDSHLSPQGRNAKALEREMSDVAPDSMSSADWFAAAGIVAPLPKPSASTLEAIAEAINQSLYARGYVTSYVSMHRETLATWERQLRAHLAAQPTPPSGALEGAETVRAEIDQTLQDPRTSWRMTDRLERWCSLLSAAQPPPVAQRAEHHLRELLAVIHRDGGHYAEEHGLEKACEDAAAKWYAEHPPPVAQRAEPTPMSHAGALATTEALRDAILDLVSFPAREREAAK